ncbi:expressed unknown protein [Seminavis robusta]|uniref:Uncharacterized protein n=1 Tax=Seminavis robusta TaxID=568900 RepID=A0A9N8HPG2_9STRA|nr:expressed unknown protein [Seminavis robusta]|eukprot:Sro1325_g262930.1 n/a (103) ;mRNA; r:19246-19554
MTEYGERSPLLPTESPRQTENQEIIEANYHCPSHFELEDADDGHPSSRQKRRPATLTDKAVLVALWTMVGLTFAACYSVLWWQRKSAQAFASTNFVTITDYP